VEASFMLFRDEKDTATVASTLEGRADLAMQCSDLGIWDWDIPTGSIVVDLPNAPADLAALATRITRVSDVAALIHPDDLRAVEAALRAHVKDEVPFYEAEYRYLAPGEVWSWAYDRGRVVQRDAYGRALRMVGTHRDITERKRIEEQLRQAQKLESIGALAAGIAHEINTPTQYVGDNTRFLRDAFSDLLGYLETMRSALACAEGVDKARLDAARDEADLDFLLEEIPRAVGQSEDGVQRIASIVRAMKEFSHPGSNEKEPVDVNSSIKSTITVARNEWKYVADVDLDLEPALPPVPGHPGEINQVILNLVINASHAIADKLATSDDEKGLIRIATRARDAGVEILIRDSGGGIPDEIRERIFDPFFTTKGVGKGTGQGLSIARSVVVDKHGGELSFETRPGEGTDFRVFLPMKSPGDEEGT
jgi:signal transduction histidine kinase